MTEIEEKYKEKAQQAVTDWYEIILGDEKAMSTREFFRKYEDVLIFSLQKFLCVSGAGGK